jgi:hypothetical protein
MLSQSVLPAISKDSAFHSPLSGQRILSYKIPQLPSKFPQNYKNFGKSDPLSKKKPVEVLSCIKPPNSNRFKYSRLSFDESSPTKKQKNFLLKPLRLSFEGKSKKLKKEFFSDTGNEKNRRVTIFNRGPNEISSGFLENDESDSEESIFMENKIFHLK